MAMLDLDYIKEWVNISDEELMNRLVKDAIGLQKEADANCQKAEVRERKNFCIAGLSYAELVEKFLENWNYLIQYFSKEEIVNTCAKYMGFYDLTEKTVLRGWHENCYETPFIFSRHIKRYEFKEYRGSWERSVFDNGTEFYIRNRYQSIRGHKVNKDLLLMKFPYLKDYEVEVYDLYSGGCKDWIFVKIPTEIQSYATEYLYVPATALFTKDTDAIINCHKTYWHNYGQRKYDEDTEKYLNSPEVKDFMAKVIK